MFFYLFRLIFFFLINLVVVYIPPTFQWSLIIPLIIFFIILILNNLGLIPDNFCLTGQFVITFFLSSFIFVGLLIVSIIGGLVLFFLHFFPTNVPMLLRPFLMVIEIVSYVSRLFSLAIRLFANLVAGHSLLHILIGSELDALKVFVIWDVFLLLILVVPTILIGAIIILEVGIASLQAYVFFVLSLIYFKEVEVFLKTQ